MNEQLVQEQIKDLKVRVFDAEEALKQNHNVIQNFLNEVAKVLGEQDVTLQTVYDYIVDTKSQETSEQVTSSEGTEE